MFPRNALSLTLAVAVGLAWMSVENQVTAFVAPSSASVRTTPSWKTTDSLPIITTTTPWTPTTTLPSSTTPRTTPSSSGLQAVPAALTALPLSQKIFLSCFLPTCLGFWRSEYGVSYAYGTATALTSYWIYQALILPSTMSTAASVAMSNLSTWHAGALIFYGVRLCLFLLYRELCTQRMKDSVKRIEAKATARGSRLKRTPFVVSCAGLYFGLCAPLLLTAPLANVVVDINKWVVLAMKTLVSLTWGGFIFAALGDFNKSLVKARKGEDHLVTGGLFSFCRHPNYTGEIIGWTANGLLAIVSALVLAMSQTQSPIKGKAAKVMLLSVPKLVGYTAASIMGALGLDFVLVQATGGLEKRQKETYGESKVYQEWVENTWPGFETPATVEEVVDPHVHPEIEVVDTSDEGGSGI